MSEIAAAIEGKQLAIGYQDDLILKDLDVRIPKGKITAIIGPNGCGKSTLLKGLARIIPVRAGEVLLQGKNIKDYTSAQAAQIMAMLPQGPKAPAGLRVDELVSYGRYPWQKGLGILSSEDHAIIRKAMEQTGVMPLACRSVDQLSGGQRQRAWIAMSLAQDTPIILLDEPTTYLDLAHQLDILQLLRKLNEEDHKTIVLVIHDLNMAARFADYMIAMKKGKILYQGTPETVMTQTALKEVFNLDALLQTDPWNGRPVMVTYRLLPKEENSEA